MKKAAIIVVALALVVWIATWFRAEDAVTASAAETWPGGLGTLDAALRRHPPLRANDGSRKLTALANALPKNDIADQYAWREITRGELAIGEPPALPDVTAIRELLLREPVIWESQEDIGGGDAANAMRTTQMTVARALIASALAKARANDAAAWEDLRAVWTLARTLDAHPQMMAQTAALSMARMINAVAWKMPLPAPAWLGELQQRDPLAPLLASFQFQSASYWQDGAKMFPTKWLADNVEHDRRIAHTLFDAKQCDVNVPMNKLGTDLTSVWRRAFRYRVEREATANALRIRDGKPIETKSVCSDGTWSFDGTTLRFSRDLPASASDKAMPLVLRVKP